MLVMAIDGFRAARDVQRILVYCVLQEEVNNIFAICRECADPRRVLKAELAPRQGSADWHALLRFEVQVLPVYYAASGWAQLCADVGALVAASRGTRPTGSAKSLEAQKPGEYLSKSKTQRSPALFVTDQKALLRASNDPGIRTAISRACGVRLKDLLPVVASDDFGILQGLIEPAAPLGTYVSALFQRQCWQHLQLPPPVPTAASVDITLGVYLQHQGLSGTSVADATLGSAGTGPACFGARCLALFSDGRCAYSVVSTDGVRGVEGSGLWEVINGHVVVSSMDGVGSVAHTKLSHSTVQVLRGVAYEEPIHIALEEIASAFDAPVQLVDCMPHGGERLRMSLLDGQEVRVQSVEQPAATRLQRAGVDQAMDRTFNGKWGSSLLPRAGQTDNPTADGILSSTPVHALLSLASAAPTSPQTAGSGPAAPRLLGLQRGIVSMADGDSGSAAQQSAPWVDAYNPGGEPQSLFGALERLASDLDAEPSCEQEVRTFTACPLRPGVYSYEDVQPGALGRYQLEMTLHANGRCKYMEESDGTTLRSVIDAATWCVESGDVIVLRKRVGCSHGFVLRESRGNRRSERGVDRVELPVNQVLARCSYAPPAQLLEPFLGYVPSAASRRVFGVIDVDAPALRGLKCRPDRVPIHAFEHELRSCGLPCDELLSDFRFIDRDEDGQIAVADIRLLETYGNPHAAPEIIHELREALLSRYASLEAAFVAAAGQEDGGKITFAQFESLVFAKEPEAEPAKAKGGKAAAQPAATRSVAAPDGDGGKMLREWASRTTEEDREALFASLNPNDCPTIDMTDFVALSLHTAILAVMRLEHFQTWIFEQFGRTDEVFKRVFAALDLDGSGLVTRRTFVVGARQLGYPCREAPAHSMFSLLDRNFDGEVSSRDFRGIRAFKAETLLTSLGVLKRLGDEKLKGMDECWKRLQHREQTMHGLALVPSRISFAAFQSVFNKAGINSLLPGSADLCMCFLFLDEASGKHSDGYLTKEEWALLKGFDARAVTGSPARLRRILNEKYGGVDAAFEQMHTSWLKRALVKGRMQTAIAGLARAITNLDYAAPRHAAAAVGSVLVQRSRGSEAAALRAPGAQLVRSAGAGKPRPASALALAKGGRRAPLRSLQSSPSCPAFSFPRPGVMPPMANASAQESNMLPSSCAPPRHGVQSVACKVWARHLAPGDRPPFRHRWMGRLPRPQSVGSLGRVSAVE